MAFKSMLTQFYPPKPKFTEKDAPGQEGRVFLVTGGTCGIGFELCKMLYETGATVYMSSRSKVRADKAIEEISSLSSIPRSLDRLKFLQIDLNDLESVRHAASEFRSLKPKLDVLVHNAGTSPFSIKPQAKTVQGLEAMVGMHCVAPLLLTQLLLPSLRAALDEGVTGTVRVVWAASISAEFSTPVNGVDFSKLDTGVPDVALNYGVSKWGNWALAREMAHRFSKEGIVSVAVNPGNVNSITYEGLSAVSYFLMKWLVLSEVKLGAYTELFASLAPEVGEERWNGAYIIPFGRLRDDGRAHRKDIVDALKPVEKGGLGYATRFWDWCQEKGG